MVEGNDVGKTEDDCRRSFSWIFLCTHFPVLSFSDFHCNVTAVLLHIRLCFIILARNWWCVCNSICAALLRIIELSVGPRNGKKLLLGNSSVARSCFLSTEVYYTHKSHDWRVSRHFQYTKSTLSIIDSCGSDVFAILWRRRFVVGEENFSGQWQNLATLVGDLKV